MKRNESILVYGVTGLLMVILFVAVVFGDEAQQQSPPSNDPPVTVAANPPAEVDPIHQLEEMLNLHPASELQANAPESAPAPEQPKPAETAPLAAPETPALPSGVRRVGDYREVTVRPGDTFSLIVQRWTGSLDKLPLVEALNEDVDKHRLTPGRTLILPWVDDAQLTAHQEERRQPERAHQDRDPAEPRPATTASQDPQKNKSYVIKTGDSLWKIAQQATTSKRDAADYVARVLEMNPGLEPERLRVGQQIKVP